MTPVVEYTALRLDIYLHTIGQMCVYTYDDHMVSRIRRDSPIKGSVCIFLTTCCPRSLAVSYFDIPSTTPSPWAGT